MTAVVNTPEGIQFFRLAAAKARIKLEKHGMKSSRGPSTRVLMAKELGLSPRAPHDEYLAKIQKLMDELCPPEHPAP